MNKNKKEKITTIVTLIILTIANIIFATTTYSNASTNININDYLEFTINFEEPVLTSDFSISYDTSKLTYIGASTEKLKTNYIEESNELICCYYDTEKTGTDKITLKFKANGQTNKTQIKATNIIAHTTQKEKTIADFTETIKINNQTENTNNTPNNIIENISNNSTIENNNISNTTNITNIKDTNQIKDTTQSILPIPKTGISLYLMYVSVIIIVFLLTRIIIKNDKFTKKTKFTLSIIIILLAIFTLTKRYVFAQNEDKILINKNNKNILIVLSTSNQNRNMSTQDFKNKTKAVSIDKETLATGVTATFKNNEKYQITIYGDENNNGTVNSSDIFELINQKDINTNKIEELCNFIIKQEEFKNYNTISNGYEEFNENSIVTPSTTPLQPATDRYTAVENVDELKKINAKVGDKYRTLGYYKENDGGNGRYDIIQKSNDITIDNGLYI